MVTHILALAILSALHTVPPEPQEPFTSKDKCLAAAARLNATNPVVLNAAPALGVRFVCLEIVQPDSI